MKKMQRTRARYVANRYSMNCKLLLGKLDDTQYIAKYSSPQAYEAGGRGGAAAAPSLKNFRATLASASCSKILNDKNYFNSLKKSRAALFFRASANC